MTRNQVEAPREVGGDIKDGQGKLACVESLIGELSTLFVLYSRSTTVVLCSGGG